MNRLNVSFYDAELIIDHLQHWRNGIRGARGRRDDRIITLLGIESPGLTSSLAIAEHVTALAQA